MKLTVVGGGSTYTPELVDGLARLTDVLSVDELVLVDPAAARTATVAGVSQRILDRLGAAGPGAATTELDEGVDGRGTPCCCSCGSAARTRAPDETLPAGVRLCRPGDDRGGRLREGAADRACRARHRRRRCRPATRTPGSSTSPTRSASSPVRCWTPGTARSGCATSRSGSSGGSPTCSASTPDAGRARPRRPEPPDLGAVGPRRTGRTCCRGCSTTTSMTLAERVEMPADAHRAARAPFRPTTCATTTTTTRSCASSVRRRAAREVVAAIEARAARRCTPTRQSTRKPELLDAARRRVLQRGGRRAGRVAARRGARAACRQRPQRGTTAVPGRRGRGRGAGACRGRRV